MHETLCQVPEIVSALLASPTVDVDQEPVLHVSCNNNLLFQCKYHVPMTHYLTFYWVARYRLMDWPITALEHIRQINSSTQYRVHQCSK